MKLSLKIVLLVLVFISSANAELNIAPINQAIKNEDIEKIKKLIAHGENLNRHIEGYNSAPVITAAAQGNIKIMKLLIENGADINFIGRRRNETALHLAIDHGHLELVKLLVEKGADLEVVNTADNLTALGLACSENNFEIIKILVEAGANVDREKESTEAPITWATGYASSNVLSYLIEHGAKTGTYEVGRSLLSVAIFSDIDVIEKIKILRNNGADINEIDPLFKQTPLGSAAFTGNWPIAKFLLESGANPNFRDSRGQTAREVAYSFDNNDFVINFDKYLSVKN